jgi:ornithine carbamoyltransferase
MKNPDVRHFLDIHHTSKDTLREIMNLAVELKRQQKNGISNAPLRGKHLAMIFEKPSTRTRVSFEVGIRQLGGDAVILDNQTSQLGRGETIEDTARVLSRYVDMIMVRCFAHQTLLDLAEYASVPVINGLTDDSHPCQLMADILTFEEHKGPIKGKVVAWVGDGNNVLSSWIHAACQFDFTLNIGCPTKFGPCPEALAYAKDQCANVVLYDTPEDTVRGVDAVVTDTWASMGVKQVVERRNQLSDYQVDDDLMALAKNDAIFMHCLPADRGEEVVASVIDGPQSVVWDEAENRLHAQKAVMLWCSGVRGL